MGERDLLSSLVRLHILHHAAHEPIYGQGIIDELGHHGYKLSPGSLYPILHGLEKSAYLVSSMELVAGRQRRVYVITESGREALSLGKTKVWELFRELFEDELRFSTETRSNTEPQGQIGKSGSSRKPTAKKISTSR